MKWSALPGLARLTVFTIFACDPQANLLSGEGVLCTTERDANPRRTCDVSEAPYVCIGTYKKGETIAYVCRVSCAHSGQCPFGEVCCSGNIHGYDWDKPGGCMLPRDCQAPLGMVLPAPVPDAGPSNPETLTPADTGTNDTKSDVGAATDAPSDI